MGEPVIRAPRCPGCDSEPALIVGTQGFCDTGDCVWLAWDRRDTPENARATARVVNIINGTGGLHSER